MTPITTIIRKTYPVFIAIVPNSALPNGSFTLVDSMTGNQIIVDADNGTAITTNPI